MTSKNDNLKVAIYKKFNSFPRVKLIKLTKELNYQCNLKTSWKAY